MSAMKTLRKVTKADLIINLFEEVGTTISVKDVCDITGIPHYDALKAMFSYIKHAKHGQEENRISISIKDGQCIRVS